MPWADELSGSEPDPKMEPFYLMVALKLGDPRRRDWIEENVNEFHKMHAEFFNNGKLRVWDSPTMLVQYLLWYERDGPPTNC